MTSRAGGPGAWCIGHVPDPSASCRVCAAAQNKMVRFRNISTAPRSPVTGIAGSTAGGNQYGQTSTIVAGPDGEWCSDEDPANTTIYGRLTYNGPAGSYLIIFSA